MDKAVEMSLTSWFLDKAVKPVAIRALLARERLESGVVYNPLSPTLRANPYPTYDQLRRKDPVHRMRLQDAWVLSNFADVDLVLRGPAALRQ